MRRLAGMSEPRPIWLVINEKSGSNSPAAIEELQGRCGAHGFDVARIIRFPDDELPDPAALDGAGIGMLAVYTGDGTLNAAITRLYGWGGAILVLDGGTMNLLYHRLHGDAPREEVIARVAAGAARRVRPLVARTACGDALAGLLAGPGTAWYAVREAMRDVDVVDFAGSAKEAIAETTGGSALRCSDPAVGSAEGYPLIEITPGQWGLQVDAFHAESPGEYIQQTWALLRRQFREGPHDRLGLLDSLEVSDIEGRPIGLLIDGERAEGGVVEEFSVAACEVDLLATENGC